MEELKSLNRRNFLRNLSVLGGALAVSQLPQFVQGRPSKEIKITVLHTNDVHSRIEPFPMDGSRLQGLGGVARRSTLIRKIREEEKNVLLFDAGDMFQGTPYFNLFDGEVELTLMSKLKYDAGTFGNHEFDNGIAGILKHFDKAKFPFLTANYDFSQTALAGKTKDYVIFEREGIKIGVFGLGVDIEGLVDKKNYAGMRYLDPIAVANKIVPTLKSKHKCDIVICLSHLGYTYEEDKVSDLRLAAATKDIDLIIGGHTHTLLEKPTEVKNAAGKITIVNQAATGGAVLGRIDFIFNPKTKEKKIAYNNYLLNQDLA
ncbi:MULTISPECIES: bifunctional metallophosphatase/5'-nucleotidase [Sphingobacterium]|uniref:Metallophosphatase n=1 Tax=Sphingobacterium litopenaei TaxID=2763500 RepID=A0ABR7YDW6_9SPHI|nr:MULTISPECIES: metallophosphatase [Sphingobacterium]MBD1429486.1 metallophosphatase [Sphingobacterium litopenaei]NGM74124.1 twin-arginine translocation signal domain-containing protein [Sphingobacterium sp. SGL-16]